MKNFVVLCALVLSVALMFPASGANAESTVSCEYTSNGLFGNLLIVGAEGTPFQAFDSAGAIVANGVAVGPLYMTPVFGAAQGGLVVVVGHDVLFAADRDGEWQ